MKLFKSAPAALLALMIATTSYAEGTQNKPADYPPDNSGRNSPNQINAEHQKENETDLKLTQRIRQLIVADETLSTNAKNVKVITTNGVVTLRGPVNTTQEKESIAGKAQQVAGVLRVDNQLEVKNQ